MSNVALPLNSVVNVYQTIRKADRSNSNSYTAVLNVDGSDSVFVTGASAEDVRSRIVDAFQAAQAALIAPKELEKVSNGRDGSHILGKVWLHNKADKVRVRVSKDEVADLLAKGFEEGRDWELKVKPVKEFDGRTLFSTVKWFNRVNEDGSVSRVRLSDAQIAEYVAQGFVEGRGKNSL